MAETRNGAYGIGQPHWPGLGKLGEEVGELQKELGALQQVLMKLIGTGGSTDHWDGNGDLKVRIQEEMGDVLGALLFFTDQNLLDKEFIQQRASVKLKIFRAWHQEGMRPAEPETPAAEPADPRRCP